MKDKAIDVTIQSFFQNYSDAISHFDIDTLVSMHSLPCEITYGDITHLFSTSEALGRTMAGIYAIYHAKGMKRAECSIIRCDDDETSVQWSLYDTGNNLMTEFLSRYTIDTQQLKITCSTKEVIESIDEEIRAVLSYVPTINHPKIGLSDQHLAVIKELFQKHFLRDDELWMHGSCIDPNNSNDIIDLYIKTYAKSISEVTRMRSNFIWDLKTTIGDRKIHILLNTLRMYGAASQDGIRVI